MDQIRHAFDVLLSFGAVVMSFVRQGEEFLRARMTEMGVADNIQTVVLVALTVLVILVLFRIFAPVLRVLLILFLLILALQFLNIHPGTRADGPCAACVTVL